MCHKKRLAAGPTTPTSCREEIDGVELRPDGVYYQNGGARLYQNGGARLMADWILDEIRSG